MIGNYHDLFGSQLEIKADSTFSYTWHFDLSSSWSQGTWCMKNDALYLKTILIYDTLRISKPDGRIVDSLVLSANKQSERITSLDITNALSSGGQNRLPGPKKLFFKNEKLIGIDKQENFLWKKLREFSI